MPEPEQQEPSGLDLARQALAEYKKRTWAIPSKTSGQPKPKPRRFVRTGDRRDPAPLRNAFAEISTDPRWEAGLAGGSIIDQWPNLCPQYAGLVQPIHYEEQTGRLDLRPGSHSYAAQLRMFGGQLAKQINDKLGRPVVRTIRVLPVGNLEWANPAATGRAGQPDADLPVKTRETASPGYRQALEAALAHKPDRQPTNPYLREALERQAAALRANREPEDAHRDAMWELDRLKSAEVDRSEAVRRAALARKRLEQAGSGQLPRRAFDVA